MEGTVLPVEIWRRVLELLTEDFDDPFDRQRATLHLQGVNTTCRLAVGFPTHLAVAGAEAAVLLGRGLRKRKSTWAKSVRELIVHTKPADVQDDERRERIPDLNAIADLLPLCLNVEILELHFRGTTTDKPTVVLADMHETLEIFARQMPFVRHIHTLAVVLPQAPDLDLNERGEALESSFWARNAEPGLYSILSSMRSLRCLKLQSPIETSTIRASSWWNRTLSKPLFELESLELSECGAEMFDWLLKSSNRLDLVLEQSWPHQLGDTLACIQCRTFVCTYLPDWIGTYASSVAADRVWIDRFQLKDSEQATMMGHKIERISRLSIGSISDTADFEYRVEWQLPLDDTVDLLAPEYGAALVTFVQALPDTLEEVSAVVTRLDPQSRQALHDVCEQRHVKLSALSWRSPGVYVNL